MNCNNCTNSNALKGVKIKHVHGNVLRMAIPLTLRTIELVDGEISATDTPFVPSSDHPVKAVFTKGAVAIAIDATMKDGNIAYIEEKGKIPVGTYAITVTCNDDNGNPYRFKQNAVLYVADATIEAGIEETIEYEVTTWYLDAAIFLALKGEDGVGIDDIETQSSGEIGGVNTVTIILTDGREKSFTILNGSGSVDAVLDATSQHPVSNQAITERFNSVDQSISDLFGDVDYDSTSKNIRFWDKGHTNVLATLDARPFIKDGMVSNAYISNNTLVITFNTDSGREAIGVPLTSVFNPNNYYTKTQVDSRIASAVANVNLTNYYTKSETEFRIAQAVDGIDVDIDTSGLMEKSEYTYATDNTLPYSQAIRYASIPRFVLEFIDGIGDAHIMVSGMLYGTTNGKIYVVDFNNTSRELGSAIGFIFLNNDDGKLYSYDMNIGWVEIIGSSDGGYELPIPKTDLASDVQTSLGKADTAVQPADLEGYATTDDVDDAVAALVSSAPQTLDTLKELADALGDDPNFATTMATQLGNKVDKESGKGLSTNDYTTAEKTKLAGIAEGAEVNVQSNWTQTNTSADDYIKNKPTLATVATSGSYNDLQDKPTIPAAYDDTALAGRVSTLENAGYITTETDPTVPAWAKAQSKPTYTASEVGALPSDTAIPSKTSDLTNDSGFIDKAMYYGTSTSAASAMPKVCTVDTFPTYTDNGVTHAKEGTIIAVKFTNSDSNTTDAPTLNVNSIGAKSIMYNNAIVTSTAKNTTIAGYTKQIAYYRYDPDLDEGNGAWEYLGKSVDSNSTYSNASLGQGYGTQSNESAATAITASISSYALTAGGIVSIKFTYDVPASATLNINSKGAKAIYNQGAAITAGVIKAGDTATFIYSTYYHLISVDRWGEDIAKIMDGLYEVTYSNGVLSFTGSNQPTYSNGILTL